MLTKWCENHPSNKPLKRFNDRTKQTSQAIRHHNYDFNLDVWTIIRNYCRTLTLNHNFMVKRAPTFTLSKFHKLV